MNRREAIKNMTFAAGYVIAVPTILTVANSCKTESAAGIWEPVFFTKDQAHMIGELAETILPATATPGAKEALVPQFIDKMITNVMNAENKEKIRAGIATLQTFVTEKVSGDILTASPEQYTTAVKALEAVSDDENTELRGIYRNFKSMCLTGYFGSELIGEKHMAYDPIPGEYVGCVPLEEASNGKSYSL